MRIVPVSCLKDNYAYLVICELTSQAAVVDPSESEPVVAAAGREGVNIVAIWNTHHHWDHIGGNKALLERLPDIAVVGHVSDRGRIPGQTVFVADGDEIEHGGELRARVIHNPGHTSGAISYHVSEHGALFTGDTLFLAGCGRLFEGTPADMHASLSRLAALPPGTLVYCGHEYTAANLRFAAAVEPDSAAISARAEEIHERRARDEPSVPAPLAEELATNPFLRVTEPAVIRTISDPAKAPEPARSHDPVDVFAALRRWKDQF